MLKITFAAGPGSGRLVVSSAAPAVRGGVASTSFIHAAAPLPARGAVVVRLAGCRRPTLSALKSAVSVLRGKKLPCAAMVGRGGMAGALGACARGGLAVGRRQQVAVQAAGGGGSGGGGSGGGGSGGVGKERKFKLISTNRKARFNYQILDTYEAGIELRGTEVKSLREGKCDLGESFARIEKGQLWLLRSYIPKWRTANDYDQHEERRKRKLLMHRREIRKLLEKVQERGLTIVPLQMYFSGQYVKVQLAVVQGKNMADKRDTIQKRDVDRALKRMVKNQRL